MKISHILLLLLGLLALSLQQFTHIMMAKGYIFLKSGFLKICLYVAAILASIFSIMIILKGLSKVALLVKRKF